MAVGAEEQCGRFYDPKRVQGEKCVDYGAADANFCWGYIFSERRSRSSQCINKYIYIYRIYRCSPQDTLQFRDIELVSEDNDKGWPIRIVYLYIYEQICPTRVAIEDRNQV